MPNKPKFVYRIHVDGVDRDMTETEIAEYNENVPDTTESAE